ncbi:hypothetical protein CDD82_3790 [Ophiocordyceps australis]|uniref:Uncharacterized protein n=1 Tax=Ophiocordyceps australis TaxID=1399860 RepID=A0A2C5YFI8_9HYPO|nr:hypothetical protein CDD82_3790 [Ophiocordyceps australis]
MASTPADNMIDIDKMRYSAEALEALKLSAINNSTRKHDDGTDFISQDIEFAESLSDRPWYQDRQTCRPQPAVDASHRNLGHFPLTSALAPWVRKALMNYRPDNEVRKLVAPYAQQFHEAVEKERDASSGLHDLDMMESVFQVTLEASAALLLAANDTDDAVTSNDEVHSSKAAQDDHLIPWGRFLTGLDLDPPIISAPPVFLLMCHAFTLTQDRQREDYVSSALAAVDWVRGKDGFGQRVAAFKTRVQSCFPKLKDAESKQDRSFWRIIEAYLAAMGQCENCQSFKTPRRAAIRHNLDLDLVLAMRSFDSVAVAFMSNQGAAWFDNAGIDALMCSGLSNDVVDLHTDIQTGETRNLLRLLYPDSLDMKQAIQTVSTLLSGVLCDVFRAHQRARFGGREDGRVSAAAPSFNFYRSRHRRIFAVMEAYQRRYPQFWAWTWEIYRLAKEQVTQAGLDETFASALRRSVKQESLPSSPPTKFFDTYYRMVEDGTLCLDNTPLGSRQDLASVISNLHHTWHDRLLAEDKQPGWGHELDIESDRLFARAGEILAAKEHVSDEAYRFFVAYGMLGMSLPYVAYHTIGAIIMVFGVVE